MRERRGRGDMPITYIENNWCGKLIEAVLKSRFGSIVGLEGILRGVDEHLNLLLENAFKIEKKRGDYERDPLGKLVLVRGDSILYVRPKEQQL